MKTIQSKLKVAYKSLLENVKKSKSEIQKTTVSKPTISYTDKKIRIQANSKCKIKASGSFTIESENDVHTLTLKKPVVLEPNFTQVLIMSKAENTNQVQKLVLDQEKVFNSLFQEASNSPVELPHKITLSISTDRLKALLKIDFDSEAFYSCDDYHLQILAAKTGADRVRLQASHVIVFTAVLGQNFEIEGHLPLEMFEHNWKSLHKFTRRVERVKTELEQKIEIVKKLQNEITNNDEKFEDYEIALGEIGDLIEKSGDYQKNLLHSSYDIYASLSLIEHIAKSKLKTTLLPKNPPKTITEWQAFLHYLFFDDETDMEFLTLDIIAEKMHSYFKELGFQTKKIKKKRDKKTPTEISSPQTVSAEIASITPEKFINEELSNVQIGNRMFVQEDDLLSD